MSHDELWWLLPSFNNLPHNSHNEGERQVEMPDSHLTTPKTLHLAQTKTGLQTPQGLDHPECIVSYPPNFSLAPTTQLLFACILCLESAFCVSMHKASSSVTRLTFPVFNLVLYCSTVLTSFSCVWVGHTYRGAHGEIKGKHCRVGSCLLLPPLCIFQAPRLQRTSQPWCDSVVSVPLNTLSSCSSPIHHVTKIMTVVTSNQNVRENCK